MDPIGGILVGVFILTVAYVAIRKSSLVLLDAFHEPELTRETETLIGTHPEIRRLNELKLRRAGLFIVGELEVVVDGDMTVNQMHKLVTDLKESVVKKIAGLRNLTVKAIPAT